MSLQYEFVIRSYYHDAFCTGNINTTVIDRYMVTDFVAHDLFQEEQDREGYKHFLNLFAASFSELDQIVIRDIFSCDDRVVARWSLTGRHTAEFMGIPATHRRIRMKGIDIFRLIEGEIVDLWQEIDFMGILQQLMAPPGLTIQPCNPL